jgi:hypothetical protein
MTPFRTNKVRRGRSLAVALVMVAATYASPAQAALDLTGTWEGTWSCKDVTSGAVAKPGGTITMTITQSGSDVNAFFDRGVSNDGFQGHVQEITAKPGQGATTLIACETRAGSTDYAETVSAKIKVTAKSATFKGVSTYELAATPTVGGQCKYSLKRTATANPGVAACPVPPVQAFPATGQTTCWDSSGTVIACTGTGHDGDVQAGATLSYTDSGDGTITDNNTGLVWEKKSDDGSIHDKDTSYTWDSAFAAHVAGLNTANFAGHNDWRLPNVKELQSIVNYENSFPPVSSAFNNNCVANCTVLTCSCTATNGYWSSSTYQDAPYLGWVVGFGGGDVNTFYKTGFTFVRAVRGGS